MSSLQFFILKPGGGVISPLPVSPGSSQDKLPDNSATSSGKTFVESQKNAHINRQLLVPIVQLNGGKLNLNSIQVQQNSTSNEPKNSVNNPPLLVLSMSKVDNIPKKVPTDPIPMSTSVNNQSNETKLNPLNLNSLCLVTPTSKQTQLPNKSMTPFEASKSIFQSVQNLTIPVNSLSSIFSNKLPANNQPNLQTSMKVEHKPVEATGLLNSNTAQDIAQRADTTNRSTGLQNQLTEVVLVKQESSEEPEFLSIKAEPPSDYDSDADQLEESEKLVEIQGGITYDHRMTDPLQMNEYPSAEDSSETTGPSTSSYGSMSIKYVLVKNTNPPIYRNVVCPPENAAPSSLYMVNHSMDPNTLRKVPVPVLKQPTTNEQNWKPSYFQEPKKLYNMADKNVKTIIKNMKYRYVKVCQDPPLYEKVSIHEDKLLETVIAGKTDRLSEIIANRPVKIVENLNNGKVPKLRVKTYHNCPDCDYKSDRKSQLARHRKVHEKRGFQYCTFCGYKAVSWSDLYQHLDCHHPGEPAFKCHLCEYRATKRHSLVMHMVKHDLCKPGTIHHCPECDYTTIWRGCLRNHRKAKHTVRDKSFQCLRCDFKTTTRDLLMTHLGTHTDQKSFPCPHCPFKARKGGTLKIHLRQHSGEKPYACNLCDYRATQSVSLKLHMKHHLEEYNYRCDHCEYKTVDARSLKVHMRVHREFTCYHCNLSLKSIRALRSHIIKQHVRFLKKQ